MQALLGAGAMAEDDLLSKLEECIGLHQDAAKRAKLKFAGNKDQDKATLDSVVSVLNTQLDPLGLKVRAAAGVYVHVAAGRGMHAIGVHAAIDDRDPVPPAGHRLPSNAASTTTSRCTTASSTCGRMISSSWAPTWTRASRSSSTRSCVAALPGKPEHRMRTPTCCAPARAARRDRLKRGEGD